ncbi:hypothetical protein RAS1_14770 [Phycisphaerae bacterium RAS1]|nr:hypothetical protein RAS1_14770 [Phycisphaerae bacterium RAS1]
MDTALLILNVSNEISPGVDERWAAEYGEASANRWKEDRRLSSEFWNQEVSTWRIEDVHAVLTWLKAIEGLEFVRTSGSSDYSSALRYWTELSKRRQQKA